MIDHKPDMRKLAKLPLLHQPGAAWRYGYSYQVLAHLVEVVSGMPFAGFLQQRIFDPLGMVDTGYSVPEDSIDQLATYYGLSETGGFRIIEAAHSSQLSTPPTLTSGSTGLVSTASDYVRFAQMLLNGGELDGTRLLSPRTVGWMTRNHLPKRLVPIQVGPDFGFNGHGFGLGFRVLTSVVEYEVMGSVGEYGWSGYAGTYFWIDPEEELIGLFMPQIEPLGYVPMWHAFRVLTYQAIVD